MRGCTCFETRLFVSAPRRPFQQPTNSRNMNPAHKSVLLKVCNLTIVPVLLSRGIPGPHDYHIHNTTSGPHRRAGTRNTCTVESTTTTVCYPLHPQERERGWGGIPCGLCTVCNPLHPQDEAFLLLPLVSTRLQPPLGDHRSSALMISAAMVWYPAGV